MYSKLVQISWEFLSIYLLTKYQKKVEFFLGGSPLSAPLKVKPPKNDTPWLPITPFVLCRILFYFKNGGICKKLDLNILRIDWAIAILNLNFVFRKKFEEFFSLRKIAKTRAIFRVPSNFFSTWSLMKPFNYKLFNNGLTSPKRGPNLPKIASGS